MTDAASHTHPLAPTDPVTGFGIGNLVAEAPIGRADARLGPLFTDHRGRLGLPALAVLFDHLAGTPYFAARFPGATLQSRLSLSVFGTIPVDDLLTGTAELLRHDERTGTTQIVIKTADGEICCAGEARSMSVGRALPEDIPSAGTGEVPDPGLGGEAVAALDPALTGAEIVAGIASGDLPAGRLADLLGVTVELDGPGRNPRVVSRPQRWLGNHFGTMHGGIIAALTGLAADFAAQQHTEPGQDYQLADLTVSFFRSPSVAGEPIVVEVEPIKVGRRIASFTVSMRASDDTLLSHGTADALFF